MNDVKCENCHFFINKDSDEIVGNTGQCCRYPPQPSIIPIINEAFRVNDSFLETQALCNDFPTVYESSWCGEFKEKTHQLDTRELSSLLSMSTRLDNCLAWAGIVTVADLMKWNKPSIKNIRNLGKACFKELEKKLKEKGINLPE